MFTPWGISDSETEIAEGIREVSTPGHGGIWLSTERQAQLKILYPNIDNFTHDLRWWEEDCDWVVPYIVFQNDIQRFGKAYKFIENLATAYEIASKYHPEILKGGCNENL
jgi:hypothetical protein